jgi:hypothetical protein
LFAVSNLEIWESTPGALEWLEERISTPVRMGGQEAAGEEEEPGGAVAAEEEETATIKALARANQH